MKENLRWAGIPFEEKDGLLRPGAVPQGWSLRMAWYPDGSDDDAR